jgi:ABC-type Fe3+-citrate transport system substrate-binding protein
MTTKERQLVIGVLTKIYTGTFNTDKSLDEQYEDFISLGEKIIKAVGEQEKEDIIQRKIKFHENKIKDIKHEIYIQNILSAIPQVNPLNI